MAFVFFCAIASAQTGNWVEYKASSLTESDDHETIYITTAEELAIYAYNVNNDDRNSKGYYCARTVEQQADIDLSAHYWTPIGNDGTNNMYFNGNGHTITGMNIPSDAAKKGFGFVGYHRSQSNKPGYIDNLIFNNYSVTGFVEPNANGGVGIVIGQSDDMATIKKCHVIDCTVNDQTTEPHTYVTHGAIIGSVSIFNAINNYYYNVAGNYGGGILGEDKTGTDVACVALAATLDEYTTASGTAGIFYDGKFFAPANASVALATKEREGYVFNGFTSNDVEISEERTFTIPSKDVTITSNWVKLLTHTDIASQTYTGSAIEPEITVKDGSKTLALGTDYRGSYSNNTNVGTATAKITGKGNYEGTLQRWNVL